MAQVTIYSTPTCVYCNLAKQFFTEKGVSYEEHNVAADLERRTEMVEKSGQMGVPVIVMKDKKGKENVVVGFDEDTIREVLEIK